MSNDPIYQSAAGSVQGESASNGRLSLRLTGPFVWGWAALVLVVILGFIGAMLGSALGSFFAIMFAVFFSVNVTHAAREARRARGFTILAYIENAVRLNLPLGLFLRAAACGEKRSTRRRLDTIAADIDTGAALGQCLRAGVPEIPPHIADGITSAENIGQLTPALSRIISRQMNDMPGEPEREPISRLYPVVLLITVCWILLGMLILVVPKFQEIFKDFRVPMPWFTQAVLMTASHFLSGVLGQSVVLLLALSILFVLGRAMRFTFTPWWPGLCVGKCVDFLSWRVPFWRVLQRHRALADVCQFLADAASAGIALPAALQEAVGLHMNSTMRHHILRWREAVLQGQSPAAGAASAGLPNLLVGFLSTASAPGKSPSPDALTGVFTFLADYYANRFSRLALALRALAEPVTTLVMGAIVGSVVIGLFLPLVTLINAVMGWKGAGVL